MATELGGSPKSTAESSHHKRVFEPYRSSQEALRTNWNPSCIREELRLTIRRACVKTLNECLRSRLVSSAPNLKKLTLLKI
uniref:Uncharacterized protein n=1 Tax=Haemonchus contortus TaxID=6289 RepID=A0A7I4XVR8_HAECO